MRTSRGEQMRVLREYSESWIDAELSAVRIELDAQRRQLPAAAQHRYDLHLPSQTHLDIRPARDPLTDQPKYVTTTYNSASTGTRSSNC